MAEGKKVSSVSFFNSRLTSIISISLVLFLLGLVFLIGLLGNKLSVYVKENISFSIVLKDNQKEADIKKMQKTLDALPYIKSTEYISKEQAVKELEEELGENPETFLGFNPLQASIEVKLHSEYANADSLQLIEKKIKKYTSVIFCIAVIILRGGRAAACFPCRIFIAAVYFYIDFLLCFCEKRWVAVYHVELFKKLTAAYAVCKQLKVVCMVYLT